MAHTFTNLLTHIIFSTKNRAPYINAALKSELFAYMGGIARELNGMALTINGMPDHVHLLVRLPPSISLSDFMRILKTNSSRWVHRKWPRWSEFAWQTGYGAFSVSRSAIEVVQRYIQDQEQHHKKLSFQEEIVAFLKRQGVEYDERFIWE